MHVFFGYDAKTKRVYVLQWKDKSNPRAEFAKLFDRAVSVQDGDVIGEAQEVKDDGPEHIFILPYYGKSIPTAVKEHFQHKHPHAIIRQGSFQSRDLGRSYDLTSAVEVAVQQPALDLNSASWAREQFRPASKGILRSWFGSRLQIKTAEAAMDGCMIALYPPPEVGKKLLVDGGEPLERLHITLIFFKDKAADRGDWDKLPAIMEKACDGFGPLEGKIGGYGVFHNKEEGDVLWAHPDVPKLAELRQELVEAVEDAGFPVSTDHGYSPHITLLYGHDGDLPALEEPIPVTFDAVYLVTGDEKKGTVSL